MSSWSVFGKRCDCWILKARRTLFLRITARKIFAAETATSVVIEHASRIRVSSKSVMVSWVAMGSMMSKWASEIQKGIFIYAFCSLYITKKNVLYVLYNRVVEVFLWHLYARSNILLENKLKRKNAKNGFDENGKNKKRGERPKSALPRKVQNM